MIVDLPDTSTGVVAKRISSEIESPERCETSLPFGVLLGQVDQRCDVGDLVAMQVSGVHATAARQLRYVFNLIVCEAKAVETWEFGDWRDVANLIVIQVESPQLLQLGDRRDRRDLIV